MPSVRSVVWLLVRVVFSRALHRLGLCPCQQGTEPLWGEYDTSNGSEMIPLEDAVAHERGDSCACLPHVSLDPDGGDGDQWLTLHHAWDGRE